jgi:hypothetical protein
MVFVPRLVTKPAPFMFATSAGHMIAPFIFLNHYLALRTFRESEVLFGQFFE